MRANMCQIKYLIRFLLLWIIFQVRIAAEDVCSYNVIAEATITSNITEGGSTMIPGVLKAEQCGEKCCDTLECSAALFGSKVCLLVDCGKIEGGCTYERRENSLSSVIRIKRDSPGISASTENDSETKYLQTTPTITAEFTSTVHKNGESSSTTRSLQTQEESGTSASLLQESAGSGTTVSSSATRLSLPDPVDTSAPAVADVIFRPTEAHDGTSLATILNTTRATTLPTTAAGLLKLFVTTGGNQQIRLPQDSVTIHADVKPKSEKEYDYHWRLIKHPEDFDGTQSGIETETLKLTTLTQGDYEFKVEVEGENLYGEASVNVTVLPKLRVNQPPVAVISPPFQELTLPTDSTLLDGSKSHDDDGIEMYEWEEVEGPLQANINKDENGNFPNEKVLKITGLVVGNYTFKLTVTDTDKASNSTLATIIVKKKIDNPPIANAGSNQVIHMPQNSAKLCGNDSTDDWGIVQYKWSLSPDSKKGVVDMQGARTKCIEVSTLEVGDYTFQLTVTDEAGQEDTAKVTLIVQPESNHPPVADAGEDQQLLLPLENNGAVTAILDGSRSTDDKEITSMLWKMASGPQPVTIVKPTSLQTTVTGITKAGSYVMTLTVNDAGGASSSDSATIIVKEEQPPVAVAGPDIVITLPDNVAMLDGSRSTDDYGIEEYKWTRTDGSPAAGFVLNQSDHRSVLHVAGLVQGAYTFVLTVTNVRGKSSHDQAMVTVMPDPLSENLVELHLNADVLRFDEEKKGTVIRQLQVLLQLQNDDSVVVRDIFAEHGTGHMVVIFYIKARDVILPGVEVADSLNSKLMTDVDFLEFKFLRADTFVCKNPCSGHGRCHFGSHECECDLFWMENFFRLFAGDGKRNCDWSVLYVGIVIFILITVVSCASWFLACYCIRRRDKRLSQNRRKTRDKAKYEKLPMKPQRNGHVRKNGYVRPPSITYKSSSIMRSLSSSASSLSDSADGAKESILFERKRLLLANGEGRFNGAFDLDTNPAKLKLTVGKTSSTSSKNSNVSVRREQLTNVGFQHQSTVLKVGNSSDEEGAL